MREFLRGWRRKTGVAALVMACLVTIAWVRSRYCYDYYGFGTSNDRVTQIVESSSNGFLWRRLHSSGDEESAVTVYQAGWFTSGQPGFLRVSAGDRLGESFQYATRWQLWGIDFGKGAVTEAPTSFPDHPIETAYCAVRYELLAVPLTLLSAYLILVPSRKRPPTASQHHA